MPYEDEWFGVRARAECLDHVIVINERQLLALLAEFFDYYNLDRPHRGHGLQAPGPESRRPPAWSSADRYSAVCTTYTLALHEFGLGFFPRQPSAAAP